MQVSSTYITDTFSTGSSLYPLYIMRFFPYGYTNLELVEKGITEYGLQYSVEQNKVISVSKYDPNRGTTKLSEVCIIEIEKDNSWLTLAESYLEQILEEDEIIKVEFAMEIGKETVDIKAHLESGICYLVSLEKSDKSLRGIRLMSDL